MMLSSALMLCNNELVRLCSEVAADICVADTWKGDEKIKAFDIQIQLPFSCYTKAG
jgi:hypothetical protein